MYRQFEVISEDADSVKFTFLMGAEGSSSTKKITASARISDSNPFQYRGEQLQSLENHQYMTLDELSYEKNPLFTTHAAPRNIALALATKHFVRSGRMVRSTLVFDVVDNTGPELVSPDDIIEAGDE